MLELAESYPSLVTLKNAQDEYSIPAAGGEDDCPNDEDFHRRLSSLDETYLRMGKRQTSHRELFEQHPGCKNWFLEMFDEEAHPEGSLSGPRLPVVFLSGAVHGNERVGPTAVLETAALLLEAAWCEAIPHEFYPGEEASEIVLGEWKEEEKEGLRCRKDLRNRGITDDERKWLARLVTTRKIIVAPTTNALGYFRGEREEEGLDPNSDFPFDLKDEDKTNCMQTVTARMINEIFTRNMVQLAATFHSGTTAVAYNWGSPSYDGKKSPDDTCQKQISSGFSLYAGDLPDWGGDLYDIGTMNDLVYPVRGGMEDWAYAGSWDKPRVSQCAPDTYNGYSGKTSYGDSSLRAFNVLVETAITKTPPSDHLGNDLDLFNTDKKGDGHIPRNIRLSLMMIDIVQPYLSIRTINGHTIVDDIVPMKRRDERSCMDTNGFNIPSIAGDVFLRWVVNGGFTIDETGLLFAKWDDLPEGIDGDNQPTRTAMDTLMKVINNDDDADKRILTVGTSNGRTRWHESKADPRPSFTATGLLQTATFSASINIRGFAPGDKIAVFAFGRLDSSWSMPPSDEYAPELPPQSHLANARTNPSWKHEYAGQVIEGRTHWFSTPVTLVLGSEEKRVTNIMSRMPDKRSKFKKIEEKVGKEIESDVVDHPVSATFVVIVLLVAVAGYMLYKREKKRKRQRMFKEIHTEIDGMEMMPDYDDDVDDFARPRNTIPNHTID